MFLVLLNQIFFYFFDSAKGGGEGQRFEAGAATFLVEPRPYFSLKTAPASDLLKMIFKVIL